MVWVNLPFDGLDAASLFRTFGLQQQDDGSLVMFYTKLEQLPPVTHTGLVGWVQNVLKMPSECEREQENVRLNILASATSAAPSFSHHPFGSGVTVSQTESVDSCELYHPPLPPLVHESVDLYSTGSALRLKTKWIAGDSRIGAWVWSDYAKVTTQAARGRSVLTCRPTGAGVV
mmetsp:Transcript_100398/g.161856  ORF Transcript_100398/g.161856 Transcript_100398/m.161856 type:complete len:174 (-) Transcript_100398:47-568(-)|eukprot:CAMPEP_0179466820 /NCGR_PEP_ID=MMETSP0799-20121207/48080_1 /TAXON_ID=46947 /ORGANISM="Geminigera cryophila, Strain CCMP2564" /LENGTH=173 /DNA_ID=CAMNT_0021271873 /DNA_START=1190 /DNA_END=1711 /DNA_ORIENTATION=+